MMFTFPQKAWIGDAVLAAFVRAKILEFGCLRMESNAILSNRNLLEFSRRVGLPVNSATAFEAHIYDLWRSGDNAAIETLADRLVRFSCRDVFKT